MTMQIPKYLKQQVTWWGTSNGGYGPTFAAPLPIAGRWEDKVELFINEEGEQSTSKAVAYVDQEVAVGDYLYLGDSSAADPSQVAGAYRVRNFSKIPNLRANKFIMRAMM